MAYGMEAGFEHLQQALAEIIREEAGLPHGVFVNVLETKITRDRRFAKVVVSIFPTERTEEILELLIQARPLITRALAEKVAIRRLPSMHFVLDSTEAKAEEMENLLNSLDIPPEETL